MLRFSFFWEKDIYLLYRVKSHLMRGDKIVTFKSLRLKPEHITYNSAMLPFFVKIVALSCSGVKSYAAAVVDFSGNITCKIFNTIQMIEIFNTIQKTKIFNISQKSKTFNTIKKSSMGPKVNMKYFFETRWIGKMLLMHVVQ